jgi:hypothetical protein
MARALAALPPVATATREFGKRKPITITVDLYDWGHAQGWNPPGFDLRGSAKINGLFVERLINPSRAFYHDLAARYGGPVKEPVHLPARPKGIPVRVSLRTLQRMVDDVVEEALEVARASGMEAPGYISEEHVRRGVVYGNDYYGTVPEEHKHRAVIGYKGKPILSGPDEATGYGVPVSPF